MMTVPTSIIFPTFPATTSYGGDGAYATSGVESQIAARTQGSMHHTPSIAAPTQTAPPMSLGMTVPPAQPAPSQHTQRVSVCGTEGTGMSQAMQATNVSIFDPRYNIRKVIKHLLLLEDHLGQEHERCLDCISKHYMTIEALLDEAISLDKEQQHIQTIQNLHSQIVPVMQDIIRKIQDGNANAVDYLSTAQKLRLIRKPYCLAYSCIQ